ncbi:hypothetical protein HDU92_009181 [Lobulomyces angularis]|nr:hypothetical protein HDU92_009181 [Lobulomyces angularis]
MNFKFSIYEKTYTNFVKTLNIHVYSKNKFSTTKVVRNHYDVLQLKKSCTKKEIKGQYYKLSKLFHPDTSSEPNAKEKFIKICEAYETLKDDNSRIQYDRTLGVRNTGYGNTETSSFYSRRTNAKRSCDIDPFEFVQYKKNGNRMHNSDFKFYDFVKHQYGHYGSEGAREREEKIRQRTYEQFKQNLENNYRSKSGFHERYFSSAVNTREVKFISGFVIGFGFLLIYILNKSIKMLNFDEQDNSYLRRLIHQENLKKNANNANFNMDDEKKINKLLYDQK